MTVERFPHQAEWFENTKDREFFSFEWEMRVGKTLPIIDTVVHNFMLGRIDMAVILAPSGVHTNWARIAIPAERPDDVIFEWDDKIYNKGTQKNLQYWLEKKPANDLLWLCINTEATVTDYVKALMHNLKDKYGRKVFLAIDEADDFKNASAKRTKSMITRAPKFTMRRTLTGTPAPQGPFDYWSQYQILSPSILNNKYAAFKQRYGIFKRQYFNGPRGFDQAVAYKDLDHLAKRLDPHRSRLTRKEVFKNLPPVIYDTQFFPMSSEVQKAYNSMRDTLMLELDNGLILTAKQRIVALLRLQQISRGYIGDVDGNVHKIEGPNNAIVALMRILKNVEGKVIIWCRFKPEVTEILKAISEHFPSQSAVRYDGETSTEERFANKEKFLTDPNCLWLVGTESTGGRGIDLSVASTMIHASHSYDLRLRLQSDSRFEGINQKATQLLMIDLVATDTKDQEILKRLDQKEDMQATLTGDKLREMLKKQVEE